MCEFKHKSTKNCFAARLRQETLGEFSALTNSLPGFREGVGVRQWDRKRKRGGRERKGNEKRGRKKRKGALPPRIAYNRHSCRAIKSENP